MSFLFLLSCLIASNVPFQSLVVFLWIGLFQPFTTNCFNSILFQPDRVFNLDRISTRSYFNDCHCFYDGISNETLDTGSHYYTSQYIQLRPNQMNCLFRKIPSFSTLFHREWGVEGSKPKRSILHGIQSHHILSGISKSVVSMG
jgi:hypothetical protein